MGNSIEIVQINLYREAVLGTTDIRELAAKADVSYDRAVKCLKDLIEIADKGNKQSREWYAFQGAYIDESAKQIVLPRPNELVVKENNTGCFSALLIGGCAIAFVALFLLIVALATEEEGSNAAKSALAVGVTLATPCFVVSGVLANRTKNLRRYVKLIRDEKLYKIREIAHVLGKSSDTVRKDIQSHIDFKNIINARIDSHTDEVVIIGSQSPEAVQESPQESSQESPQESSQTQEPITRGEKWEAYTKSEKAFRVATWVIAIATPVVFAIAFIFENLTLEEVIEYTLKLGLFFGTAIAMLFVYVATARKQRERYSRLADLSITQQVTCAAQLATLANRTLDDVVVDIKSMIEKGLLNAQLDSQTHELTGNATQGETPPPLSNADQRVLAIIKKAQIITGAFFCTISAALAIYVALVLIPAWGMATNTVIIFVLLGVVFLLGVGFLIAGTRKVKNSR